MSFRLGLAAARVAALGGVVTLGIGSAQAAQARPELNTVHVGCSVSALSSAISGATDGETIELWPGCVYTLSAALPDITNTLTIVGNNDTIARSSAPDTPSFSILTVDGGEGEGNLTLDRVNFSNGGGLSNDYGGAIDNGGYLTVHGGVFRGNYNDEYGGAIYNDGTMTVSNATFTGNTTDDEYGGAIYNDDTATVSDTTFSGNGHGTYEGGAIYNDDTLTATDDTFSGNSAEYGGALYNDDQATLTRGHMMRNTVGYDGGAIYNDDTLTVNRTVIYSNVAAVDGGGIYNDDETVTLNGALIYANHPDNCDPVGTVAGCST